MGRPVCPQKGAESMRVVFRMALMLLMMVAALALTELWMSPAGDDLRCSLIAFALGSTVAACLELRRSAAVRIAPVDRVLVWSAFAMLLGCGASLLFFWIARLGGDWKSAAGGAAVACIVAWAAWRETTSENRSAGTSGA